MRTTLTLDDDLAGLLKQRARGLGIPFKEAVNRTIRAGIGEATATRRHPAPKTISNSFGFMPGIDLDKLGQLTDELEAEAFADKIHVLPDVSVLVQAHNADSALHDRARLWWDACLSGTEGIGLA
jgi:hypothetical protein